MASKNETMKSAARKIIFAIERYGLHELANHAAAGAYAFLLSATPAVLLVLGIATALLRAAPEALAGIERFVMGILGPLDAEGVATAFFHRPLGGLATVFGGFSLVWAARLFVVTVQRGLRVVWARQARKAPIMDNLLTFVLELACLVAAVAVLVAAQAARIVAGKVGTPLGVMMTRPVATFAELAPTAVLLLFVYMSYRYAPSSRPDRRAAGLSSALCVASYVLISRLFALFVNAGRYTLLYGFFGSLIVLLVNVYVFFCLFYYFAELAYVQEHLDALLLARLQAARRRLRPGKPANGLDKALFLEPEGLLRRYGRSYEPGELIFELGSTGRDSYVVHRGKVGVFLADGALVASVGPGEVFGEMAAVLEEARTATTRALEESLVLAIPPAVFSEYLAEDAEASRGLVASLSSRLKEANLRNRASGEAAAGEAAPAGGRG